MNVKVILSSPIIIGTGDFSAKNLTLEEAIQWMDSSVENYCGHETVRILGLDPNRGDCEYYDEALSLAPKERLEFGREYTIEEIQEIGVEFKIICRMR